VVGHCVVRRPASRAGRRVDDRRIPSIVALRPGGRHRQRPGWEERAGRAWALRPEVSIPVAVTLLLLLAWFGLELLTSGGHAGLAERMLGEAQAAWPFLVTMSGRHPLGVPMGRRPGARCQPGTARGAARRQ
jgi:hypothetical protein